MTKTFTIVAALFVTLELGVCYNLWFDQDASKLGDATLAPANFEGWKLAQRGGSKWMPVERQLSFFSLWVANNKFILSTLLAVCAFSQDGMTRLLASFFTSVGCAIYFISMDSSMRSMEDAGDVRTGQADELGSVVSFLLLLWLCAFAAEAHDSVKNYHIHLQKAKAA